MLNETLEADREYQKSKLDAYEQGYKQGKADAEPHWIPVTKQPPEVGKSVMICDAYGDICIGHRTMGGYYFPDYP